MLSFYNQLTSFCQIQNRSNNSYHWNYYPKSFRSIKVIAYYFKNCYKCCYNRTEYDYEKNKPKITSILSYYSLEFCNARQRHSMFSAFSKGGAFGSARTELTCIFCFKFYSIVKIQNYTLTDYERRTFLPPIIKH